MYTESRFVLNATPCFRDGFHERITEGLYNGAIAVSDRNRFSDHIFANLENFVSFDWADPHWQSNLDTRLAEIQETGGDFDPEITRQHLAAQFPLKQFVVDLLTTAQKIRERAA